MPDEAASTGMLDDLLDDLDVKGQAQYSARASDGQWTCQRSAPRQRFRAACDVCFLAGESRELAHLPGRTRNISRNGLSFVVRRMFSAGEPVELELRVLGRPPMYVAGTVEFCRYVGRGSHEVGVALRTAQAEPIFSQNLEDAAKSLKWLEAALGGGAQAPDAPEPPVGTPV